MNLLVLGLLLSVPVALLGNTYSKNPKDFGMPIPTKKGEMSLPAPHQLKWHEAEIGAVFHYDLHVFDGKRYSQNNNRVSPIKDVNIFNPQKLDTEQWVLAAKAAGAKFAVITATHETGFAIYPSDVNPYCTKALKWRGGKGDVVGDFVKACRKHGIQPGVYIGIRWNAHLGIFDFKVPGDSAESKKRQADYRRMCEKMTEEICSRYGDLFMIWYDGGAANPRESGPDVLPIVAKLQPQCLFYHNSDRADFRWGMSESGTVPYPNWSTFPVPATSGTTRSREHSYHGDPNGVFWVPAMADTPLRGANGRHEWFWEPNDENAVYSTETLLDMYEKSVGRNATLILGLTPDPDGLMPQVDVERLKSFGDAVNARYGKPVAKTSGRGNELVLKLKSPQKISAIIIQEDIALGHRIRAYEVEGEAVSGKRKVLCSGTSVGHKRIEKLVVSDEKFSKLKLRVTKSEKTPEVINFSAFSF